MSREAPYTVSRATRASRIGGATFALLLAVLATFPLWADRGWMRDFDEFACYFLFALMWNLLAAYGGMVSIGQQAFFGIGGYALLAMGNLFYRDVKYLIPFIVQFWTLASPVYYSSSMVPERYRWLYGLNPMAGVIDGFRWALTGTGQAPTAMLLPSVLIVCSVLFGGLVFFNYMEGSIADRV